MERHTFTAAILTSVLPPFIGGAIVWALGYLYEIKYPSPDKEEDLDNNWKGIQIGTIFSCVMYTLLLFYWI